MKKMNNGKYRITRFAPDNRKKNIYIYIYEASKSKKIHTRISLRDTAVLKFFTSFVENSLEKYKYEYFFRPKFHLTLYQ